MINQQNRVRVNLREARRFQARLRRTLKLRGQKFMVCLVDDRAMRRLNSQFRGKDRPTDVLSFPWRADGNGSQGPEEKHGELRGYLGDVVISTERARASARLEGHSTEREIRWLMLHGALHLLGYDHETDSGRMTRFERRLRARLRIA